MNYFSFDKICQIVLIKMRKITIKKVKNRILYKDFQKKQGKYQESN